jgi:hypothetical protein
MVWPASRAGGHCSNAYSDGNSFALIDTVGPRITFF